LDIYANSTSYDFTFRQPIEQTPSQEIALGFTASYRESLTSLLKIPFPLSAGADDNGVTKTTVLRAFQEFIPNHKREATDRASSMESLPTREAITDLVISERRFLTKSRNSSIFLGKENLNPCFKCSQTRSIGFNSGE
jgi:hypothetical protein